MRIAIIHEFLTQYGGAERVLEALLEIYPDADLFTLVYDKKKMGKYFDKYNIKTSFIQKLPFGIAKYKWYLPFMPKAIESFDLSNYDLVISDSSAYAKGVKTDKNQIHICYCHTPTRYLWQETAFYLKTVNIPFFVKPFMPIIIKFLKKWDYKAAQRPDYFIANSQTTQKRISAYYHRDSFVIYPFVNADKFEISQKAKDYYLIVGRIVPYKRNDIIIKAFNKLNLPLKIIGSGYGLEKLKKMTQSDKIEFLDKVSDRDLKKYYSGCKAFVFAALEDFGITPLEAMASGRPVIAYGVGGATETVIAGKTGIFFDKQTSQSLIKAIKHFDAKKFNAKEIRQYALKFDKSVFKNNIKKYINQKINSK